MASSSAHSNDDDDITFSTPVGIDMTYTGLSEPQSHVGTIRLTNTGLTEPQSHVGTIDAGIHGNDSGLSDFHSIISDDGNSGYSSPISHVGTISGIEGVNSGLTDAQSHADNVSVVGSVAFTITSTIVDGVKNTISHWKILMLGQAISLVLTAAGATSEILDVECGVSTPATYNGFAYFLATLFSFLPFRRECKKRLDNEIDEEQLRFYVEDDDVDRDSAGSEDELTVEHESPSRGNYGPNANSNQNKSGMRYPFLCGTLTIHTKWYYYFILALIETQAYYFIFLAFRYTSFTFVYISDALAIPSAMIFTRTIMKKRYSWTHLLGAVVCITGVVINTLSDMENKDPFEVISSADHIKGDCYAIIGAVLLGLDDVLSEIAVTDHGGVNEIIFMKGLYGTLISIVQLLVFELESVPALFGANPNCDVSKRMLLFSVHIGTRSIEIAGEMKFLYISEAALLNISLLTSDLYAALFDITTVGLELTRYYYIAFILIFSGIILYESGPSPNTRQVDAPINIEIRQVKKDQMEMVTENAGNATNTEAELT